MLRSKCLSNLVALVLFNKHFDAILTNILEVGTDCIAAFYDTVLNVGIIANINIIKNNGILDVAVITYEYFLEDN